MDHAAFELARYLWWLAMWLWYWGMVGVTLFFAEAKRRGLGRQEPLNVIETVFCWLWPVTLPGMLAWAVGSMLVERWEARHGR